MKCITSQRGLTLIELVVTIVIMAIAVSAVLGVLAMSTNNSSEAMMREQMTSIANAYLQEALSKPFVDPAPPAVEASRNLFDDMGDYNFIDAGVHDYTGAPVPGLGSFTVQVTAIPAALPGIAAADSFLVTVRVTDLSGSRTVVINGYRTRHL